MDTRRATLFIVGCIGLRTLFAVIAKRAPPERLEQLGYVALIPAMALLVLWLTDGRAETAAAGGTTWWMHWRVVHAAFYFSFARMAIAQEKQAWMPLAADAVLALGLWGTHRVGGVAV